MSAFKISKHKNTNRNRIASNRAGFNVIFRIREPSGDAPTSVGIHDCDDATDSKIAL